MTEVWYFVNYGEFTDYQQFFAFFETAKPRPAKICAKKK